ncbi:MAG: heat-inducible transcription repressor HrcA [Deltaproteobacteria bacterium]|nr:heat-inducible transcription repressor HrcA [Candidatus Anaeroferrophillus wilburensis]MBN2888852.1 heat-inducible transcription repressor HrcA [Deltaproteobacteria bacterium]
MEALSERYERILAAIVLGYIRTAEPIGSRTIARNTAFNLSPATIRNAMADLEDYGLLCQPHTSAGRIPTDRGFRYYVDHLLPEPELPELVKETIRNAFPRHRSNVEEVLKEGVNALSRLTPYVSMISLPHFSQTTLKHIRFVRLNDQQILAVIISDAGLVQNILFGSDVSFSQDDLNRFSNYLNRIIDGLTLEGVKRKIFAQMQGEKDAYDSMMAQVMALSRRMFDHGVGDDSEIIIDGKLNILEHPEFADADKMKRLFRAFEEKSTMIKLLDEAQKGKPLQVYIGGENRCEEMSLCSVIVAGYGKDDQQMGNVGIIGPTRMDYSRIIPLVRYTAEVINTLISD